MSRRRSSRTNATVTEVDLPSLDVERLFPSDVDTDHELADALLPDGVVPLHYEPGAESFFFDLSPIVDDLNLGEGEYVEIEFNPDAYGFRIDHRKVQDLSKGEKRTRSAVRALRRDQHTTLVTIPTTALRTAGLHEEFVSSEAHDPGLFKPVIADHGEVMRLDYLGRYSEVFRPANHLQSPITDTITRKTIKQFGADRDEINAALNLMAKTLGEETLKAASVPYLDVEDREGAIFEHSGDGVEQTVAIYIAPSMERDEIHFSKIADLYGFSGRVAHACRVMHRAYAKYLTRKFYGGKDRVPFDHPLRHEAEPFVIPLEQAAIDGDESTLSAFTTIRESYDRGSSLLFRSINQHRSRDLDEEPPVGPQPSSVADEIERSSEIDGNEADTGQTGSQSESEEQHESSSEEVEQVESDFGETEPEEVKQPESDDLQTNTQGEENHTTATSAVESDTQTETEAGQETERTDDLDPEEDQDQDARRESQQPVADETASESESGQAEAQSRNEDERSETGDPDSSEEAESTTDEQEETAAERQETTEVESESPASPRRPETGIKSDSKPESEEATEGDGAQQASPESTNREESAAEANDQQKLDTEEQKSTDPTSESSESADQSDAIELPDPESRTSKESTKIENSESDHTSTPEESGAADSRKTSGTSETQSPKKDVASESGEVESPDQHSTPEDVASHRSPEASTETDSGDEREAQGDDSEPRAGEPNSPRTSTDEDGKAERTKPESDGDENATDPGIGSEAASETADQPEGEAETTEDETEDGRTSLVDEIVGTDEDETAEQDPDSSHEPQASDPEAKGKETTTEEANTDEVDRTSGDQASTPEASGNETTTEETTTHEDDQTSEDKSSVTHDEDQDEDDDEIEEVPTPFDTVDDEGFPTLEIWSCPVSPAVIDEVADEFDLDPERLASNVEEAAYQFTEQSIDAFEREHDIPVDVDVDTLTVEPKIDDEAQSPNYNEVLIRFLRKNMVAKVVQVTLAVDERSGRAIDEAFKREAKRLLPLRGYEAYVEFDERTDVAIVPSTIDERVE